jgi:hypothetical protein
VTLIAIILIAFSIGFGGGWGVKGWKDGADVARAVSEKEKVESRNAILQTANANCATDIEGVRQGVAVVVKAVEDREKAASDAMKNAESLTEKHKVAVASIKALPPVPAAPDAQCAVIIEEQKEYVQTRHSSN